MEYTRSVLGGESGERVERMLVSWKRRFVEMGASVEM